MHDDLGDEVFDDLDFTVLAVGAVILTSGTVAEDAVLERLDHVDSHPVLEALIADDDLLLQKLVGDQILWPVDDAGNGTMPVGARADRTLRCVEIEADVRILLSCSWQDLWRPYADAPSRDRETATAGLGAELAGKAEPS